MKLIKFAAVLASVAVMGSAQAALITWELKAGITEITPGLSGYANLGDEVTLRYTFDQATTDSASEAERGKYENAVINTEIMLNGLHATVGGSDTYITIVNDFFGRDEFLTSSGAYTSITESLPSHNGYNFSSYSFFYRDYQAAMFGDTNLFADPIFDGYDMFTLSLGFLKPVSPGLFYGEAIRAGNLISFTNATNVSPVPAPPAFILMLTGLGLLGLTKRLRKAV